MKLHEVRSQCGVWPFSRMLSLRAFAPFKTAEEALENINAVAEGSMTPMVSAFLEANLPLPKPGKSRRLHLACPRTTWVA